MLAICQTEIEHFLFIILNVTFQRTPCTMYISFDFSVSSGREGCTEQFEEKIKFLLMSSEANKCYSFISQSLRSFILALSYSRSVKTAVVPKLLGEALL